MRFSDIVRSAIANSFRSKTRTTLTVVAIVIGAFTLTITSAIGSGVSSYINTQVAAIGEDGVMTVTKKNDAASTDGGPAKYTDDSATTTAQGGPSGGGAPGSTVAALTTADITTIEGVSGVISVEPSVRVAAQYIQAGGDRFVLALNPNAALTKADLAAGAQLDAETTANQILLPDNYVDPLGFSDAEAAVGQTVTIGISDYLGEPHAVEATVAGVQNTTLFASGASINRALTDALVEAQNTGRPASVATSYRSATVMIDPASTPAQIDAIKADLTKAGFTGTTVADQLGTFQTVVNGIVGVLNAFAVIALIAAGFGIINTLLMSVQERTREIGLMKAMGLGGGRIFTLFSLEAVFIGFLGSAIGAGLAAGVGTLISGALSRSVLSDLPGLDIMLFTPGAIAVIVVIVMGIAFLAGTLPARRASVQNPIDALRYE